MPRKTNNVPNNQPAKAVAPAMGEPAATKGKGKGKKVVEEPVKKIEEIEEIEESEDEVEEMEDANSDEDDEANSDEDDEANSDADEDEDEAEAEKQPQKRHIRTPVERIDTVTKLLANFKLTKTISNEIAQLRKQLEGATIKPEKKKRAPNAYNIFIKEKMAEKIAENPGKKPKELFGLCIQDWNEQKAAAKAAQAAQAVKAVKAAKA